MQAFFVSLQERVSQLREVEVTFRPLAVLWASFFCQAINDGFLYGADLLPPFLAAYFHRNDGEILLLVSLLQAPQFLLGPISGYVTDKLGPRTVIMLFGALGSLALCASTFFTEFWAFLSVCGVTGVCLGLYSVPRVTAVSFHFSPKWRTFATTFATIGGSMGSAAFPFIFQVFLANFPWQSTFVFISCILLQTVVCGALMGSKSENSAPPERIEIKHHKNDPEDFVDIPNTVHNEITLVLMEPGLEDSPHKTNGNQKLNHFTGSRNDYPKSVGFVDKSHHTNTKYNNKTSKNNTDNEKQCIQNQEQGSLNPFELDSPAEDVLLATIIDENVDCLEVEEGETPNLLQRMAFPLYLVHYFTWAFAEWGDCIFPLWMDSEGESGLRIATLITVTTSTSVLGKIIVSYIAYCAENHLVVYSNITVVCLAFCNLGLSYAKSYPVFLVLKSALGLFFGAACGLYPGMILNVVGLNKFNSSMGILNLFIGLAGALSPPLAGFFVDYTGSYRKLYRSMSVLILFSVVFMLPFHWPLNGMINRFLDRRAKGSLETSPTKDTSLGVDKNGITQSETVQQLITDEQ